MLSTSLLGLLKEFRRQNLQNFVQSASAYAFDRRPNFLKNENVVFGLMSKIRLRSYTDSYVAVHSGMSFQHKFMF